MSDTNQETVRITLGDSVEKLPPGTVVEIDLLGGGVTGYYSRLIAFHCGSDDEDIITATEMLRLAIAALKEAISSKKSREDTDFWLWLLRWLDTTEDLLSTREAGAGVKEASRSIIMALRDDIAYDSPDWRTIVKTMDQEYRACCELAEEYDQDRREWRAEKDQELSFRRVHEFEPGDYSNHEDLSAGLELAAQVGLDAETLELGVAGEDAACIIRGRLP
jgi:hypothetical protein